MPLYQVQTRETWTMLTDYEIEAESREEAEEIIQDGQARHHDCERINREVDVILTVEQELSM